MINFIETSRLILSPINENEINGGYIDWINNQESDIFTQHAIFPHTYNSLINYMNEKNNQNSLWLGIFTKEKNLHIGNIEISGINWVNRTGVYSILIGDKFSHRKGYAFEASIAIINHAFNRLNLNRIELGVASENEAALLLYDKIGFEKEGELKQSILKNGEYVNSIIMGLLRQNFKY